MSFYIQLYPLRFFVQVPKQPATDQGGWALISGLAGVLVGAVVSGTFAAYYNWRNRRSEERRWYAEFLLKPRLDAIRSVHRAMVECHYALNLYCGAAFPGTLAEFKEKVESKVELYLDALVMSDIYLPDDAKSAVYEVLGSFRQMKNSCFLAAELPVHLRILAGEYDANVRNPDWKNFTISFDKASARLKEMLSPDGLTDLATFLTVRSAHPPGRFRSLLRRLRLWWQEKSTKVKGIVKPSA